jgi:hypothetical protein
MTKQELLKLLRLLSAIESAMSINKATNKTPEKIKQHFGVEE